VLESEVAAADGTVHPARGDQFLSHVHSSGFWGNLQVVFILNTGMLWWRDIKNFQREVSERIGGFGEV